MTSTQKCFVDRICKHAETLFFIRSVTERWMRLMVQHTKVEHMEQMQYLSHEAVDFHVVGLQLLRDVIHLRAEAAQDSRPSSWGESSM